LPFLFPLFYQALFSPTPVGPIVLVAIPAEQIALAGAYLLANTIVIDQRG